MSENDQGYLRGVRDVCIGFTILCVGIALVAWSLNPLGGLVGVGMFYGLTRFLIWADS